MASAVATKKQDRRLGAAPVSRKKPSDEQPPQVRPKWNLIERQNDAAEIARLKSRVHELETAIMEQNREEKRALSIYGSENALEELTMQVALSPQFAELTPAEHRYVASVGLASGLNPVFHLHAWKQEKRYKDSYGNWQTREVLTVMPDYKALIASANDPIMTSERRLTTDEMRARGISEDAIEQGAIAYEVTGTNLRHANLARTANVEYTPSKGYGWWAAKKEVDNWVDGPNGKRQKQGKKLVPNDTPSGRDGEWVARKRAIRDLFNQIADLRLKFAQVESATIDDDSWVFQGDPDAIEGEFTVVEREPYPWSENAITRAEAYRVEKDVTDDEINAAIGCDEWRKCSLTPDEWKIVVDQVAVKKQIAASTSPVTKETEETEAAEQKAATTDDADEKEIPAVFNKPEVDEKKGKPGSKTRRQPLNSEEAQPEEAATQKCVRCEEAEPSNEGPFPFLCAECARKAGDEEAAKAA